MTTEIDDNDKVCVSINSILVAFSPEPRPIIKRIIILSSIYGWDTANNNNKTHTKQKQQQQKIDSTRSERAIIHLWNAHAFVVSFLSLRFHRATCLFASSLSPFRVVVNRTPSKQFLIGGKHDSTTQTFSGGSENNLNWWKTQKK